MPTRTRGDFLARDAVRRIYDRHAGLYDLVVSLYHLVGMRIGHWRRLGIEALDLRPGDTIAAGWDNVELVCAAAADYRFPERVDGILATGVLNYEPDYDAVIARGATALAPGRRWVVLDYKMPRGWRRHLAPLFVALGRSFGVSRAFMDRHPWESIQRHLCNTEMRELYGGFVYISSGEAP